MVENAASHEPVFPGGTVTFLFTDIEGSTKLLRQLGDEYVTVLTDQRRILRAVFDRWHGSEVDTQGDSFFVAFPRATEAVAAAVEIQHSLSEHHWPQDVQMPIRMGLHTGEPLSAEEGYVGIDVHRAARIAHVGHGGQVLLSATTAELVMGNLPEGVSLLDLGRHRLKDISRPEHIRQLIIHGLPSEFPSLKSLKAIGPEVATEEPVRLPAFLEEDAVEESEPVFVGREIEIGKLTSLLQKAISGQGGVAFIAGDAGSGKTALLDAFSLNAIKQIPNLLVARGTCNAFTGSGDPYVPFRMILRQLTGDVETAWKGGLISKEGAGRLWNSIPLVTKSLVKCGPNLIDTLIPGPGLRDRVSVGIPAEVALQEQVNKLVADEKAAPGSLEQQGLFEEVWDVLVAISDRRPVLLLLDDMQWADSGSINLLFHLGRELAASQILLLCAYRPEEVALGRRDSQHPLEPVLNELKRTHGDIWIDLNQIHGEHFVSGFIDTEPNKLNKVFRNKLYKHTAGHPLFTVELLRDLQERGNLIRDDEGRWIEGPELDWSELPARIEGVIAERIGRLEAELREILNVAAVEGEDFTAQVVARIQKIQERQLLRTLSRELEKQHHLVSEKLPVRIGKRNLSRYRFTHALFQRYLYNDLGLGERRLLHGEIADMLEELYTGNTEQIAVQLARHYTAADIGRKAVEYLLHAGDRARSLLAHQEAIDHYQRALVFFKEQGELDRAARLLMKLGLTYHLAFNYRLSQKAFDEGRILRHRAGLKGQVEVQPPAPHPLRLAIREPITLDPTMAGDYVSSAVINQLFSGLLNLSPELDVVPDVAQSWEVLEGGRSYIFHLRKDVLWSDGFPVTAGDFEYAWKRVLRPATKSLSAKLLYDIKEAKKFHKGETVDESTIGVSAIDPLTLCVELDDPASYFLNLLSHHVTYPVPRHVVEVMGRAWTEVENIVTNGPFRLEQWLPGKTMSFSRNDNFHLPSRGNLQQIAISLEEGARLSTLKDYETGNMDAIWSGTIPRELEERARQRHADEYLMTVELQTTYMYFDTSHPPFDDLRVRQAFAMTTDQETLSSVVHKGQRPPALGGFIPRGIPGYSPDIGQPFDPEWARQLLSEAGYPGGAGFPKIKATIWRSQRTTMEFLAAQWREILGIKIDWDYTDYPTYIEDLGSLQLGWNGWIADYPDPDSFLRTSGVRRCTHWNNTAYNRLIKKAGRITDQAERIRLYQKADQLLVDEAVIIPLTYGVSHWLVKPWVRNFRVRDWLNVCWKDIVIDPH